MQRPPLDRLVHRLFRTAQGDADQVQVVGRLGAEHHAVGLVVAGGEHGMDERRQRQLAVARDPVRHLLADAVPSNTRIRRRSDGEAGWVG